MSGKGSNDLNLLLKTKVVKLRAELDLKNSLPTIKKQVDIITERLKNKPVKLRVQLDYKLTELRSQLKTLETALFNSKSIKPIRLSVEIDVKGSAKEIKKQLKEIHNTVDEFNKKYGEQVKKMHKFSEEASKKANQTSGKALDSTSMQNIQYVNQLKDAEKQMRDTFGKKGIFSSEEIKDASGNLLGFTTRLEKANGVVQQFKYSWGKDTGNFQLIDQKTFTATEKMVHKARQSLASLRADIEKLGRGKGKNNLIKEWEDLNKLGKNGTLEADSVNTLKTKIKDENVLQQKVKETNSQLHQRNQLMSKLQKAHKDYRSVAVDGEYRAFAKQIRGISKAEDPAYEYKRINLELDKMNNKYKENASKEKEALQVRKERLRLQRELNRLERNLPSGATGLLKRELIEESKAMFSQIKTAKQLEEARNRLFTIKNNKSIDGEQQKARRMLEDLKNLEGSLKHHGMNMKKYESAIRMLETKDGGKARRFLNVTDVENELNRFTRMLSGKKVEIQNLKRQIEMGTDITSKFGGKDAVRQNLGGLVDSLGLDKGQMSNLQNYIGGIEKAKVATMSLGKDAITPTGEKMRTLVTTFESYGKTARQVTYGIVQGAKGVEQLRHLGEKAVFNANRNLGVFEQLKIAMARVPVWMGAMTAFYGSIRSVTAMTREIIAIDTLLTNIRRVSSDSVNVDAMFKGAVSLSKELGNNLHDILNSLGDFSRTFGQFNERQLLAITKTATLMSNVSELTAQEATESLVGTMNAFNITAEKSVRIVDALNEVDNNYAVSTKQLAEGLSKSASTARTFGVAMEENIGHITAISSVTMESGKQIGNGLKTIYSRITTLDKAEEVLNDVGVSIKTIGENGETYVRPVNNILSDLADRWWDLSDAERQNISVQVAGRYQLSRFLALMNNYHIALDATSTAVNSQGSAMRENAEYMKSFEARLNQLKNSFSAMSLAVGDAILSDAMLLIIELLKDMAEVAVKVSNNIGVLPAIFLGLFVIANKMGIFAKLHQSISSVVMQVGIFGSEMKKVRGTQGTLAGVKAGWDAVTIAEAKATAGAKAFAFSIKGALISTGIGAIIVALGFAIEKFVSYLGEAKQKTEELEKLNKQLIESYRELGGQNGLEKIISRYEELNKKMSGNKDNLSTNELMEYQDLVAKIGNALPSTIDRIDAQGNAHLKTAKQIREHMEVARQLSELESKMTTDKYTKTIKEQEKAYRDAKKALQEIREEREKIEVRPEEFTVPDGIGGSQTYKFDKKGALSANSRDEILAQQTLRDAISDTLMLTQQASLAYLDVKGSLSLLGDSQMKAIENFIAFNEHILISGENSVEAQDKLFELGKNIGDTFAKIREEMNKSANDDPFKLADIEKQFDSIAKAIPESFFKMDDTRGIQTINRELEQLLRISIQIGQDTNYYTLKQSLIEAGLSAKDAGIYISNLAREQKNSALRAEAQKDGVEDLTDSIDDLNDSMKQSIELQKALFNQDSSTIGAIKSHIEVLEALRHQLGGDIAEGTDRYGESVEALSEHLGISAEKVTQYRHEIWNTIDAIGKITVKTNEHGDTLVDDSNLNDKQKKIYQDMVKVFKEKGQAIDVLVYLQELYGDKVEETSEKAKTSISETSKQIDNLTERFEALKGELSEDNRNTFVDGIRSALDTVNGKILITSDEMGNLKLVMANGTRSPLLEIIEKQLKELGMGIELVESKTGDLEVRLNDGKESVLFERLSKDIENAKLGLGDIEGQVQDVLSNRPVMENSIFNQIGKKSNEASKETGKSLNEIMESANNTEKDVKKSFESMDTSIKTNTVSMITQHDNQAQAITRIADSARRAKDDIESLNKIQPRRSFSDMISGGFNNLFSSRGGNYSETSGSFGALSGEGSSSLGGGGTGTSGTIIGSVNADGHYGMFGALSGRESRLQDLHKINNNERSLTVFGGLLRQLETRMQRIAENTRDYRDALKQVVHYQNINLSLSEKELDRVIKRQRSIENELKSLKNVSKHTEAQREKYNQLQQEFEQNSSKVASLRADIESTINDIRAKSIQVFTDFVGEIVGKYDIALNKIRDKVDDIKFKMNVLELTDPDNLEAQLKFLSQSITEYEREQATLVNARNSLQNRYNEAVKLYGKESQQAKTVEQELKNINKQWQEATLNGLRAEQQFRDVRAKVADDGIKQLKDYYSKRKDMSVKAIEEEQRVLKKAHEDTQKAMKKSHDEQMKMYDERIAKINELYDNKIKSMDDEKSEEDYQSKLSEKNIEKAELVNKIALLSNDKSLEGRKKLAETQQELIKLEKDIADFMRERQRQLLKEQLEEQKKEHIKSIEGEKNREQEAYDHKIELMDESLEKRLNALDVEKEAISKHYDDIINDERRWATIREQFIKGNFKMLTGELNVMSKDLEALNKGNFDSLTKSFRDFSQEVKDTIAEMNKLTIGNLTFNTEGVTNAIRQASSVSSPSSSMSTTPSSSSSGISVAIPHINMVDAVADRMFEVIKKAKNGSPLSSPTATKNEMYAKVKGSSLTQATLDEVLRKAKSGTALSHPTPETTSFYEYFKKLLKMNISSFATGGYTGTWSGNHGKLGILHKKEIILNQDQTRDILDIVKVMEKLTNILPSIKRNNFANQLGEASIGTVNNYELTVNIESLNGNKQGANVVVKEIMTGLKKIGK